MIGMLNVPRWYVAYTMPRAERRVAQLLNDRESAEAFLPLYWVVKQWSDRRVRREEPLFPGYVFVRTESLSRLRNATVNGLVKFLMIERQPVTIKDTEIAAIRRAISGDNDVCPTDYFHVGTKVRVSGGSFNGMEGIVEHVSGKYRLTVRIDTLMKAFSVNIPASALEVLESVPMEIQQ